MDATLARLRRLQAATLFLVACALAVVIGERALRAPPRAASPPPGPTRDEVEALVRRALEDGKPELKEARAEAQSARTEVAALEKRILALEDALRGGGTRPGRVVEVDREVVCRITNERRGLFAVVGGPGAADAPQEPARLEPVEDARIPLLADPGPVPRGAHGLLAVRALVTTNNAVREDLARRHRLALVCASRQGTEQQAEIAAATFKVVSEIPSDALRKTLGHTALFRVGEGARLELSVDAGTLARDLGAGGVYEVRVRVGPLVVFEGEPERHEK